MTAELSDDLIIRFPARSGYLEICRLNATAMAASVGFDVSELDDLRLAVDEAVAWLLGDETPGMVELAINRDGTQISFGCTLDGTAVPERQIDDLLHAILGATTDQYDAGLDDAGKRYLSLVKRAADG